jgi:hypothetical protein
MWETPAALASSKERCEGWDCFTVPRFARFRHFHGPALDTTLQFMYSRFVGSLSDAAMGHLDRMNLKPLNSELKYRRLIQNATPPLPEPGF